MYFNIYSGRCNQSFSLRIIKRAFIIQQNLENAKRTEKMRTENVQTAQESESQERGKTKILQGPGEAGGGAVRCPQLSFRQPCRRLLRAVACQGPPLTWISLHPRAPLASLRCYAWACTGFQLCRSWLPYLSLP